MSNLAGTIAEGYVTQLSLTIATLIVAAIGTFFAWRNHRLALKGELPEILFDPLDHGLYPLNSVMFLYFKLNTHHPNAGWRVHRVEVVEASPKKCLRHGETNQEDWREYDDFDHPIESGQYGGLEVRPGCRELTVRFLCKRPRNRWWGNGIVEQVVWIGPITTSWQLQKK